MSPGAIALCMVIVPRPIIIYRLRKLLMFLIAACVFRGLESMVPSCLYSYTTFILE